MKLLVDRNVSVIYLQNTEQTPNQKVARAQNAVRLHAFNHSGNGRGQRFRVAVAEAEEYSEGVSFMHVRRVIVDFGYGLTVNWAIMEQRIGRALRSCSHEGLPLHWRTLQVDLFLATHGQFGSLHAKKNCATTRNQPIDTQSPSTWINCASWSARFRKSNRA